jgi:hypothetical protein
MVLEPEIRPLGVALLSACLGYLTFCFSLDFL